MARRDFKKTVDETSEVVTSVVNKKKKTPTKGVVSGCERLNVRKEPSTASEVVTIIDAGDKVTIDHDNSTNGFYKISMTRRRERPLEDEKIEGFCMKTFITVK